MYGSVLVGGLGPKN